MCWKPGEEESEQWISANRNALILLRLAEAYEVKRSDHVQFCQWVFPMKWSLAHIAIGARSFSKNLPQFHDIITRIV